MILRTSILTGLFCLNAIVAWAGLSVNSLISDGAVLQRERPVHLWGQGDPGAQVAVELGEATGQATVGEDGGWSVELPAMAAGGPYRLTVRSGEQVVIVSDLLFGDVWVCAGQSNMYFALSGATDGKKAIAAANNPDLRLFVVSRAASDEPQASVQGSGWLPANKYSVSNFSAVGYYFGDMLQRRTDVPIGLIMSTVGGTLANNWTSREVLESNPDSEAYFKRYEREKAAWPQVLAEYEQARKSDPAAARPREPEKRQPAGYYNGMIAPLFPFPVKGVIWYQGESDSWKYWHYDRFLRDLIADWRKGWQEPDMPFLIVQLAGLKGKSSDDIKTVNENYPAIREVQRQVAREPNNGLAVAADVGEAFDIHPRNKRPVGERLARTALAQVYGVDIAWHGPEPVGVALEDGAAIVTFEPGSATMLGRNGPELADFELAGADQIFHPAQARIEGDQVVVTSREVPAPVSVRYAWKGFPAMELVNDAGLPASPFVESIP
ncbi:hypothetical protein H5P28_14345 [Ruficoccus amylovorans]|uniref:Sialate O-acetylesterase domain-containing protein n=1 Tax=Ruficoccus amylovorans TaxID=1804625 RepID=A0A842HFZ1_9BACT|nr:sialate O-acetylesterase [Ruficoccus amylovorans]MBC2595443.1 hypothetical protein [Ruficoccus amylovorans]